MKNFILFSFIALIHHALHANEEPNLSIPIKYSLEISTQEIQAILSNKELPNILPEEEQIRQITKGEQNEFSEGSMHGRYVEYEIYTDTGSAKAFAVYFFYEDFAGPVKPVIYFQTP